jgi:cysteine desulfurase
MRAIIEQARLNILARIGLENYNLVFTSGATESNNSILKGFEGTVFVSSIEHSSALEARPDAIIIPSMKSGVINLEALERLLAQSQGSKLVSIMAANNETGVIQPIQEIAELCKTHNAYYHADCVQVLGRAHLDFNTVDAATFSGHKIGAPAGVGFSVLKKSFPYKNLLMGGGQEHSRRAGTENIIGIIGLEAAIHEALQENWKLTLALRNNLEAQIQAYCPEALVISADTPRLPNTSVIYMQGMNAETQVIQFDLANVALSAGSACSSGKVRASHVLKAMGYDEHISSHCVRISLPPTIKIDEVNEIARIWISLFTKVNGCKQKQVGNL